MDDRTAQQGVVGLQIRATHEPGLAAPADVVIAILGAGIAF